MKLEIDRCRFSHASSVMHTKGGTFFALPVLLVSHPASFRFGCPGAWPAYKRCYSPIEGIAG